MKDQGPSPDQHERFSSALHAQHEASRQLAGREGTGLSYRVSVRRVIAFAIDCAALVAIGFILARFTVPKFEFIDQNWWWAGLAIAAIYFGVLDSSLGSGATLGKRLMEIEVQRLDGEMPAPIDAVLRFAPFAVVSAMYKISVYSDSHSSPILIFELVGGIVALAIVVFGLMHPHRRNLSDILLNTVVVRDKAMFTLPPGSTRLAVIVFSCLAAAAVAVQGVRAWDMRTDAKELALAAVVAQLKTTNPLLKHVKADFQDAISEGTTYPGSLFVSAYAQKGTDETKASQHAKHIYDSISSSGLTTKETPLLKILIKNGFDIGIWQSFEKISYTFTLRSSSMDRKGSIRTKVMRPQSVKEGKNQSVKDGKKQ